MISMSQQQSNYWVMQKMMRRNLSNIYDKVNLLLRFEFNNGRRIINEAKNQRILFTVSTAKFSTLIFLPANSIMY